MAGLSFRGVKKSFGKTDVVHGIDTEIADGEFVVVVGPSGCGKSTLLRMIAGLEEITEGQISIGDRVVNDLDPKDRDIAMVFQNYALYPHMSVYGNMAYGLRLRKTSKSEIKRRVNRVAEVLEIRDLLDRKPRQLSGGQRQRVAMGRAIVREPSVFLFDEPLSNLDAKLRVQMRVEIKTLQRRLQTTTIYVTHDQVEAMTLADRLIVMNEGRTEQIGNPLEVYQKPVTTFVAGFIGSPSMNFLPAAISSDGTNLEIGSGHSLRLSQDYRVHAERRVILGIRPEHLIAEEQSESCMLRVQIELTEMLGSDTLVYGVFGRDDSNLTIRLPGSRALRMGQQLLLSVSPENLHVFDLTTERRLNTKELHGL